MKLSIITINYNNAVGLEKTIKSVINQNYKDYEYIIIDGGSSDGSKQIIESHSNNISYWVSEPDYGIYNAMNKGIARSKGEYCHFLNSGDIYAQENILSCVFENKQYSPPLLRGTQICDCKTHQIKWINRGNKDITLYDLYVDTLQHQATFIRRDLFEKYGLYDEKYKIASDWKFFMQCMQGGESSFYLGFDIVIFDMSGISNNPKFTDLMFNERHRIIDELIPITIQKDYDRLVELEKQARKYRRYLRVGKFINKLLGKKKL